MTTTYFIAAHGTQTFTRSTKSRAYTHMVAARPSYEFALKRISRAENDAQDLRNGRWYFLQLEGKTFDPRRGARADDVVTAREYLEYFRAPYADRRPVTDEEVAAEIAKSQARAVEALNGALTPEAYAQARHEERAAKLAAQLADGHFDRFQDGGWASRLGLAQKNASQLAAKPWNAEVVVLEAQEVDAKTFRAAAKKED